MSDFVEYTTDSNGPDTKSVKTNSIAASSYSLLFNSDPNGTPKFELLLYKHKDGKLEKKTITNEPAVLFAKEIFNKLSVTHEDIYLIQFEIEKLFENL